MSRALVTGGCGFIGAHLVRLLHSRGQSVRVFDLPRARWDQLPGGIEIARGDIQDRAAVEAAVRDCDTVYHLAANPQLWTRRRGDFRRVNFLGTVNVLDAAAAAGARRILHCSTESILTRAGQTTAIAEDQHVELNDVVGPYCRSKFHAERYAFRLAAAGVPVVVVNPTLPVGPGDFGRSPPTQLVLDCVNGKRPAYLDADLNLIDARDVAAGMLAAVERGVPGRRYLLGVENWSVKQVFEFLAAETGLPPPKVRVPYPVALVAAVFSEFVADVFTHAIPAATVTGVRLTRRRMHFDASRSLIELGLSPRPVAESLREAVAWYRTQRWA